MNKSQYTYFIYSHINKSDAINIKVVFQVLKISKALLKICITIN